MRQKRDLILILRKVVILTGTSNNEHMQLLVNNYGEEKLVCTDRRYRLLVYKSLCEIEAGWLRQIGLNPPTACLYTTLGVTSRSQLLLRDKSRNLMKRVNNAASNFFSEYGTV